MNDNQPDHLNASFVSAEPEPADSDYEPEPQHSEKEIFNRSMSSMSTEWETLTFQLHKNFDDLN